MKKPEIVWHIRIYASFYFSSKGLKNNSLFLCPKESSQIPQSLVQQWDNPRLFCHLLVRGSVTNWMVNPISACSFIAEVDKAKVPSPFDSGTENVHPRFLSQAHPTSPSDLRPYLNHFRVDPLPHFNSSVSHQHRPVQINVNQGSSLSKKKKNTNSFHDLLTDIIICLVNENIFPGNDPFPSITGQNTHRHVSWALFASPWEHWAKPGQRWGPPWSPSRGRSAAG